MPPNTPLQTTDEQTLVHVLQSSYHYRDVDNMPTSDDAILEEEGWFADQESAEERCSQLNARNRTAYDVAMARARRDRENKIAAAEQANREAAILREHGMTKKDVPVPSPFVPTPFENYTPEHGYTTYRVVTVSRSEHDGIQFAQAPSEGVQGAARNATPATA